MNEYEQLVVGKITPSTLWTLTRSLGYWSNTSHGAFCHQLSHTRCHASQWFCNNIYKLPSFLSRGSTSVSFIIEFEGNFQCLSGRRFEFYYSYPAAALRSNFQAASVCLFSSPVQWQENKQLAVLSASCLFFVTMIGSIFDRFFGDIQSLLIGSVTDTD